MDSPYRNDDYAADIVVTAATDDDDDDRVKNEISLIILME